MERTSGDETVRYESPKILATYDADDLLAEAETGSVIIVVG